MTKSKQTKSALFSSVVALLLCFTMLLGTTFAWFTDNASTSVNKIQAGTLDVQLLDASGNSLEGKTLAWQKAAGHENEEVLWEPGCTYNLQTITIKNNGNLALKYKIEITGIDGDAELNKAIDWTIKNSSSVSDLSADHALAAGASDTLTISGHMKETAGNEYQGLSIDGIAITVLATQDTVEYDSNDNQYDKNSQYDNVTVVTNAAELKAAIEAGDNVMLANDIDLVDTTIAIREGIDTTLDLGGNTIYSEDTRTETHNFLISVTGGTFTASNGEIVMKHTGANMGWNGAATVINVTAGGVLNLDGVTVKNEGGTDMNFAVHLNNWGEVTMNADNCVFDAPYCSVRVFNSGADMNNVKIKNSTLTGKKMAFWVHNYVASDLGTWYYADGTQGAYNKELVDARLNLDIYGNSNNFNVTATENLYPSPIRYGFNSGVYYDANGNIVE